MAYGEPVHPIMQFDPSDSTYLYLMTSYQVRPSAEQSFGHRVSDVAFVPTQEREGTIAFALTPVGRASEFGALAGVSEGSAGGAAPLRSPVRGGGRAERTGLSGFLTSGGRVKRSMKDAEPTPCTEVQK